MIFHVHTHARGRVGGERGAHVISLFLGATPHGFASLSSLTPSQQLCPASDLRSERRLSRVSWASCVLSPPESRERLHKRARALSDAE